MVIAVCNNEMLRTEATFKMPSMNKVTLVWRHRINILAKNGTHCFCKSWLNYLKGRNCLQKNMYGRNFWGWQVQTGHNLWNKFLRMVLLSKNLRNLFLRMLKLKQKYFSHNRVRNKKKIQFHDTTCFLNVIIEQNDL